MNIVCGIEPLDDMYGHEEGKPCLFTLVCSESSRSKAGIEIPLLSECLHLEKSIVYYGLEPILGLTGTRAEVLHSIHVQERLHKINIIDPTNFDVGQLRDEVEVREADIVIVKPPVWKLYDAEGGYDGFYRTLKDISREMCKKIVVLAEDIDDVVASKRHADMTVVLLFRGEEEPLCGQKVACFDAIVDLNIIASCPECLTLEYHGETCTWSTKD